MEPETSTNFVMKPKVYDFLKKCAMIWFPSLGTLYFALGALWGLPAADKVTGTVIAVDTFLGVVLNISKNQYVASGGGIDGTITVTPNDEGTQVKMGLDPNDLVDKSKIVLKVTSTPPVS